MNIVDEATFRDRIRAVLAPVASERLCAVTGPGRSGAIASVYASHVLGLPFIPFGARAPVHLGRLLIVDTARSSGRTLRRAESRYAEARPLSIAVFVEPPRVHFWYEQEPSQ